MCSEVFDKFNALCLFLPEFDMAVTAGSDDEVCPVDAKYNLQIWIHSTSNKYCKNLIERKIIQVTWLMPLRIITCLLKTKEIKGEVQ